MINKRKCIEVIRMYVDELSENRRGYCVEPKKANHCDSNCKKCTNEHYDKYFDELIKKCGLGGNDE